MRAPQRNMRVCGYAGSPKWDRYLAGPLSHPLAGGGV